MGKKSAAKAKVASPSPTDSWLESLNAADRKLAESCGCSDATALAREKAKMEERSKKAVESQQQRTWENKKNEAWQKAEDKKSREKEREEKKWQHEAEKIKARALKEGVLESHEHLDGSWYVQVGADTWKVVQDKFYCTLCDKHLNDCTLNSHIESKDHVKKLSWQGGLTTAAAPSGPSAPAARAVAVSASASAAAISPDGPLEPWQELGQDGWQVRCIPCGKVIDACHLASEDHISRLQAWQDRQLVLQSGYQAPALPYLAYVPADPNYPDGERWIRCLLCKKWVQDEYSHCGTHMAPDGSKEHRKNLVNYPPNDPWYQENVTREKQKYHPSTTQAATSVATPVPKVRQTPTPAPWAANVPTPAASWANAAAGSVPYPAVSAVPQPTPELPKHWIMVEDKASGRPYYYHSETRETRWDPPTVNEC